MKEVFKKLLKKEIRITFNNGEKKEGLIVEGIYGNTLIVSKDEEVKFINLDAVSYATIEGLDFLKQLEGQETNKNIGNEPIMDEQLTKIKKDLEKHPRKSRRNQKKLN